jgi:glucose uptake protein
MILPETYSATVLLMVLSMIFLGSWASTYKASHSRFELYYFDFSVGFLIAAIVLAFTLGTMGFDGFSFLDDILHASKRADFDAVMAGVVFSLANMLLMAAISVAGMAVAFPVAAGLTLIVGLVVARFNNSMGNPPLVLAGGALVLAAVVLAAAAYRFINVIRHEASAKAGKAKSTRRPVAVKGIVIAVLSGCLMGWFYPLLSHAREGELGLGPYSVSAFVALGAFLSTCVFNLFFMNLPMEGEPVDFMEYFQAAPKKHGWAIFGGVIWCAGLVAALVSAGAENVHVASSLSFGLSQAPALVAILWGALVWKEFKDGDARINALMGLTFVLFGLGVTLISMAQAIIVR